MMATHTLAFDVQGRAACILVHSVLVLLMSSTMSARVHIKIAHLALAQGQLYVSVGSYSNVDADSSRSRIRRFVLPAAGAPVVPAG
jgi:hypothetical protein